MNEGTSLIDALAGSEEIEVFETENLINYVTFKWDAFAWAKHMTGFIFHLIYIGILCVYTYEIYVLDTPAGIFRDICGYLILVGLLYPMSYDFT